MASGALLAALFGIGAPIASGATSKARALLPASVKEAGTLTIATDANWPVCEYYPNGGSKMAGYEVDIWNALAKDLGVTISPTNVNFTSLIPGVQDGRFSLAMACISDSPAREKQVRFVDYAAGGGSIYVTKENTAHVTANPLSECGLTTATQVGTSTALWVKNVASKYCVKHGKSPITNMQFPSENSVLLALYGGKVDFIEMTTASGAYASKHATTPIVRVPNPLIPKTYSGIIFSLKNTRTAHAFLAALQAIQANGVYDSIMKKWTMSGNDLKTPGINLASKRPLPVPTV